MVDELAGRQIGERIQVLRERKGKSRAVVAGLVGRSERWLKKVEKGHLLPPRLEMLVKLANAIGVSDLTELTGSAGVPLSMARQAGHEAVPGIREAILEPVLRVEPEPRPDAADLKRRVDEAWILWHASTTPRADVGRVLPQLVRDAERAVRVLDGKDRRKAAAALSELYALAEQALAWVAEPSLVWLVADRCMQAAQQADDPLVIAGAAWVVGNVRRIAHEEEALELADDAATMLKPFLAEGNNSIRAMYGALNLHGAISAARAGREGDARRRMDLGSETARNLPDGYVHPWTVFSTANVDISGVSVEVDLRQGRRALEAATAVNPDRMPSVDRRARLWLEMARSYWQARDAVATLSTLQRAASVSLESMQSHPLSRGIAGELVTSGGGLVERDARLLATQLGLSV